MNRRAFLEALGVLAAAAALPLEIVREKYGKKAFTGEHFVLNEPLIIPKGWDASFIDCHFEAAKGYFGDLIRCSGETGTIVFERCVFDRQEPASIQTLEVDGLMFRHMTEGALFSAVDESAFKLG
jgi:hypothetical protein